MLTRAPRSRNSQSALPRKRRVWPWAAGSILLPLVVIAATLLGARYVSRARLAAMVAPAPALAPLDVTAVIQPPSGVALWTVAYGKLKRPLIVSYDYQALSTCLPGAPCSTPRLAAQYSVYDGGTGGKALAINITPTDVSRCAPLLSSPTDNLYLVCPGLVTVIAPTTGRTLRQFVLPAGLDTAHAALGSGSATLYLTGSGALYAYDTVSGARIASQPLSGAVSAPVIDGKQGRVFVLENGGGSQPALWGFDSRTLHPLGAETLPAGWRAGPREASSDLLYLYSQDGAVGALNLGQPQLTNAQPYPSAQVSIRTPLRGARALGWDELHTTLVALYADHVTAYDAVSLQPYAEAPVSGAWDEQRPLVVDGRNSTLYAPDASGAVVALSLTRPAYRQAPDAATALALARAGLASLLPDTNQAPPFLSYQTFPVTQTTLPRLFAIHYSDLGWRGPYPGSASAKVTASGSQPGDYSVMFTVTWDQLFIHTHTWNVELLPDGRVKMLSDTGDAIP